MIQKCVSLSFLLNKCTRRNGREKKWREISKRTTEFGVSQMLNINTQEHSHSASLTLKLLQIFLSYPFFHINVNTASTTSLTCLCTTLWSLRLSISALAILVFVATSEHNYRRVKHAKISFHAWQVSCINRLQGAVGGQESQKYSVGKIVLSLLVELTV